MDIHQQHQQQQQQQQQQQYPQSEAQAPFYGVPSYDPFYDPFSQPHYDSSVYSFPFYDHPLPYPYHQLPPPVVVDPTQQQFAAAPLNEGMEDATYSHSSEFEVPMNTNADRGQGGGDTGSIRGQDGRRGGEGGFCRRNFRGRNHSRGRGRGRGRGQEHVQPPPPPKPAKQLAWCDICRVGCNSVEILEQHKAGKRHKRSVQRIQEYEAQQKQLAGYQSTVVISTTTEVGPSVAEIVHQTSLAPVAVLAPSVTNEAGANNLLDKGEIPEEHNKESEAQNQPVIEAPSECDRSEAGGTQAPPLSEASLEEAAASGKRPFTKRPRPDGYGLGSMHNYSGVARFDCGVRRGGQFEHGGKRPRQFGGDFQSWTPMSMPMMPPYSMMAPVPMPAPPIQRVRPVVCTVCNVTCDTPSVFDKHVSGKKHRLRISRVMVCSNMVFGPITVFIPPGQPSPYPNGLEPVFYGITTPELIKQHEMLIRNQIEDECEEGEDAGEGDQPDINPEERDEGHSQEEAMFYTEPSDIKTNAELHKDGNGSATEPTSGTVGISSRNEYQGTEVATNDSDVVPGLQTTTDVTEEVTDYGLVG